MIKDTNIDTYELHLPDGTTRLTVVARGSGLERSIESNSAIYTSGNLTYQLSSDGEYYIVTGVVPGYTTVSIPKIYGGRYVREIAETAFMSNGEIETLIIPNTVRNIGRSAFAACDSLKTVVMEDDFSTVYLRNSVGWQKPMLKAIYSADGSEAHAALDFVGYDANGCGIYKAQISTVFPDSFNFYDESTGAYTPPISKKYFSNFACYEIYDKACLTRECEIECAEVDADIASKELKIGDHAFANCTLKSVYIPNTVREISSSAFNGATGLQSVTFSEFSGVRTIADVAFGSTAILEMTLPYSLVEIGDSAFIHCSSLEIVSIDRNLKRIGECAFKNCSALISVEMSIYSKLEKIGESAFENCGSMTTFGIPNPSNNGELPETLWFIGKLAFNNAGITNNGKGLGMADRYGWLYTEGNVSEERTSDAESEKFDYEMIDDFNWLADALRNAYVSYNWYKIDKLPAPTISLNGQTLTITDSTGLATTFNIYANGEHWATVNIILNTITLAKKAQQEGDF